MTPRVAIVGSGLGGLVTYATLRHGGIEPGEIAVFGDDPDPAGAWRPRAAAIRQRLMLPLALPAIASLAIFQFLWTWNDLLVALTFGRETQPITVAIFTQLRQFGSNIELIAPAAFVSLAIPLAVFFAFQRYFVQGLLAGSVK